MGRAQNIEALLEKYLENRCTPEEAGQILQWLSAEEFTSEPRIGLIKKALERMRDGSDTNLHQYEHRLNMVFERISAKIGDAEKDKTKKNRSQWLLRLSVAAVVTLVTTFACYLVLQNREAGRGKVVASEATDLAPGGNKAVLTLGDGSRVILEDVQNGSLVTEGAASITKKDGQLIYSKSTADAPVFYNVITTPQGGQYQLTLEDGSKVWLNAASSIRFPTTFREKERKIEITGEAYFEIAKDALRPFKVLFETPSGTKSEVTVLGTHFNIMCYKDEKVAKTTLVEGSVLISNSGNTAVLKPAQQASIKDDETIRVRSDVNINEAIAWKNGYFEFYATSLQEVMRQVGRWYDVEISYEGKIPERKFGGKISRESNASEILKILELSQVRFRIEDKKIIVTP